MPIPLNLGNLKWVITSTPKSGTRFISKWLTKHGYPTGHEQAFHHPYPNDPTRVRVHNGRLPGDSSFLAAPWTPELRKAGLFVVKLHRPHDHIVRSLYRIQMDLAGGPFGVPVKHYTTALDEEPFSRRQYEVFVEQWTGLIECDVTWNLLELDDSMLTDLPKYP